jgi:hypothetical protein
MEGYMSFSVSNISGGVHFSSLPTQASLDQNLLAACSEPISYEKIKNLLEQGANPYVMEEDGFSTPLSNLGERLVRLEDEVEREETNKAIELLIQLPNFYEKTAKNPAAVKRILSCIWDSRITLGFIDAGAELEVDPNIPPIIHTTCYRGDQGILSALVKKGLHVFQEDLWGDTPLAQLLIPQVLEYRDEEREKNRDKCIQILESLENFYHLLVGNDTKGSTLYTALKNSRNDIALKIIQAGASVTGAQVEACMVNNVEGLLLIRNALGNAFDELDFGNSLASLLCPNGSYREKGSKWEECMEILLSVPDFWKKVSKSSDAPAALCNAIRVGELNIINKLLDSGVDVNGVDRKGWRPIAAACLKAIPGVIKALLDKGAELFYPIKRDSFDLFSPNPFQCLMSSIAQKEDIEASLDILFDLLHFSKHELKSDEATKVLVQTIDSIPGSESRQNYELALKFIKAGVDVNKKVIPLLSSKTDFETPLSHVRSESCSGWMNLPGLKMLLDHPKLEIREAEKFLRKEEIYNPHVLQLLIAGRRFELSYRDETGKTPFEHLLSGSSLGEKSAELFLGASFISLSLRKELKEKRESNALNHSKQDIQELLDRYQSDPDRISRELAIKHSLYEPNPAIPFAWMVFLSDGYFTLCNETQGNQNAIGYLKIARALPMELQMKLANITVQSNGPFIKKEEVEKGFRTALKFWSFDHFSSLN